LKKENETIKEKSFVEVTRVDFVEMTEEQIRAYIATGDCMDKAGAYGIQGYCAAYISGICGDYNNVVGLPVCRVCTELRNF
jgi:septum formation protein